MNSNSLHVKMQKEFLDLIKEHHVLNLSTCKDNEPWSASCFYAFNEEENYFVFASSKDTKHIQNIEGNPNVSGTITLETKEVGLIQGLQFSGSVKEASSTAKKLYFKTYPYAIAMLPTLWELKVSYAKLTNNRLGFGKKLEFKL
ncbi:MAG: pyridoxamine 5'-phosphate oxidase family protein [Campylobacteraceae bacterium]